MIDKLELNAKQAGYVTQLLKSKGWAVLKDRLDKRKQVYVEKMLKENNHDGLLSLQGKINGINSLLEEVDNVIRIGNDSEQQLKNTRR
jgi:hypothetical protein